MYGFGVVLLEMLIGRRALDKSRPSREHNLVEWCRPLLNNNKKLLRILDARIDGQYSLKAMMRVATLGYQCLSQNPKGRPSMSHAVDVLEAIYEEERIRDMAMSAQNEAPKENPNVDLQVENKIIAAKNEEERVNVPRRRKREGRSKSEPQNDVFAAGLSLSPEVITHNKSYRDQLSE